MSDRSSADDAHFLVLGGDSRIALALSDLLGDAMRRIVRRPSGRPSDIIVGDYAEIPADAFQAVDCVINCVGISTGSEAELRLANVTIPLRAAAAAKAAGVRRFIHISSFSVYGAAHTIDRNTPVAPVGDYGRSKLAADEALLELMDCRFAVTILRLPLIYGQDSLGKLGQLMRLWRRAHVLPVPVADVSRAMISVELSAEVIARLCSEPRDGIVFAADPQAFSYTEAAKARHEQLWALPVPKILTRLVERAAPAIGSRLFANSQLAEVDNLAVTYHLSPRLYRDLGNASLD